MERRAYATYDESTGRYRILGVVGPDEYRDALPGSSAPGLDDNAYTNVAAAWILARALDPVRTAEGPSGRTTQCLSPPAEPAYCRLHEG